MQAAREHAAGLEASAEREMASADEAYMLLGEAHSTVSTRVLLTIYIYRMKHVIMKYNIMHYMTYLPRPCVYGCVFLWLFGCVCLCIHRPAAWPCAAVLQTASDPG
jgi:hypothetical protein